MTISFSPLSTDGHKSAARPARSRLSSSSSTLVIPLASPRLHSLPSSPGGGVDLATDETLAPAALVRFLAENVTATKDVTSAREAYNDALRVYRPPVLLRFPPPLPTFHPRAPNSNTFPRPF